MLFQKKIICIMVWYEALVYISTHILVTLMKVEIVSDAALKLGSSKLVVSRTDVLQQNTPLIITA